MIGRAGVGAPSVFGPGSTLFATGERLPPPTLDNRVDAAREHFERSLSWKGEHEGVVEMHRRYSDYFKGLPF